MAIALSGSLVLTGSLTTSGNIVAQTLVVQTVTSSIDYITGSSINGSLMINTHDFTGSVRITGSITQTGVNTTSSFAGVVSIGTTTPTFRFDLSGDQNGVAENVVRLGNVVGINNSFLMYKDTNNGYTSSFSNGLVGIGTTTPATLLHLYNGTESNLRIESTGAGGDRASIYVQKNAGGGLVIADENRDIIFRGGTSALTGNGGTEFMRITSGGSVGIGTTSPGATLDISADAATYNSIYGTVYEASIYSGAIIARKGRGSQASPSAVLSGDRTGFFGFAGYNSSVFSTSAGIIGYAAENWTTSALGSHIAFETTLTGSITRTERMRITSGGHIGLGNSVAPWTSPFTVIQGGAYGQHIGFQSNAGDIKIGTNNYYNGSGASGYVYISGSNGAAQFNVSANNGFQFNVAGTGTAGASVPFTASLAITNGGNVGIGTTTAAFPLEVKGLVATTGTNASYLFQDQTTSVNWQLYANSSTARFYNSAAGIVVNIAQATGVYTATSDINKKKDFELSTLGLDAILGLKPTLYRMKVENDTEKHLGFIAQEVKEFIPQAYVETGEGEDKFIGLTEMPIIATLTKAIQELKAENDNLQAILQRNNIN